MTAKGADAADGRRQKIVTEAAAGYCPPAIFWRVRGFGIHSGATGSRRIKPGNSR
jgi:hypothetical protein